MSSRLVFTVFCLLVGCTIQTHSAPVSKEAVTSTPVKSAETVELGNENFARSTAEEKALHEEVAVPKTVQHPRIGGSNSVVTVEQTPVISEMELNEVAAGQRESKEIAAENTGSSPAEPEPEDDDTETLNAPAQLGDDTSDSSDEFANQARQLASLLPDDVDISPRAAAEYLMVTGDFESFDQAIADLVASDFLSVDDAASYREAVNYEFDLLTGLLLETQQTYEQSEFPESLEESQQLLRSQPDNVAAEVEPSVVDDDADSDPDSRPTNDQLQSFLANEATLGEMLQVLSQQYQMKSSQSEPIRNDNADVKDDNSSNNQMKNVIDLLSDSMKQDAASAAQRLKNQDASSGSEKTAESELQALTHKGPQS
ncbi:hypothetical protein LSAT2_001063 [Lamellibrachia satsuma]|nr:hypothetical protein LSAT2_001063 [Lamellibrachia satsuma]